LVAVTDSAGLFASGIPGDTVGAFERGMSMRILIGLMAGSTVLLAGCAPTPISADRADPVPADRIFAYSGKAGSEIVVTRDSGFVGSGCTIRFYIDGNRAADFHSGEVARFGVKPGKHTLGAEPINMCGGSGIGESEIDIGQGQSVRRRIAGASVMPTSY
jgi:hypothetical protein